MTHKESGAIAASPSDTAMPRAWPLPPVTQTDQGDPRRVGLELEFTGLSVAETAALLAERFDAVIDVRSRHDVAAEVPALGAAEVALDTRHAKHLSDDSELAAAARD
ncbi:MAG: amidoligase family protein, partial [Pseudomonadota bacterium]